MLERAKQDIDLASVEGTPVEEFIGTALDTVCTATAAVQRGVDFARKLTVNDLIETISTMALKSGLKSMRTGEKPPEAHGRNIVEKALDVLPTSVLSIASMTALAAAAVVDIVKSSSKDDQ